MGCAAEKAAIFHVVALETRGFFVPSGCMLQSLHVRNLALLEEVSLDFEAGFTAVTGETGAGKSILLGALGLLAGERADKSIIRQGAPACEVEAALFFAKPKVINAVLAELELPECEDGLLILKRSVPREKAPKITVNGSLATLAVLQRLGEHWVDFHGPSEPRRLLKDSCQLELLDLFGRAAPALSAYQQKYGLWRERCLEREKILGETKLSPSQLEFLQNQLTRLAALELTPEAIETLERDFKRMNRAQELIELTQTLAHGLVGEDGVKGQQHHPGCGSLHVIPLRRASSTNRPEWSRSVMPWSMPLA
jgi:DNA repair protein RecN (Recombination protein N)